MHKRELMAVVAGTADSSTLDHVHSKYDSLTKIGDNTWLVTKYAACDQILRDRRFPKRHLEAVRALYQHRPIVRDVMEYSMMSDDMDRPSRHRGELAGLVGRERMMGLGPRFSQAFRETLGAAVGRDGNVLELLIWPYVTRASKIILSLPDDADALINAVGTTFFNLIDARPANEAAVDAFEKAASSARRQFEKWQAAGDLSGTIWEEVRSAGDAQPDSSFADLVLAIAGAFETTGNLLASTLLYRRHWPAAEASIEDKSRFVEEVGRLHPSIRLLQRRALHDAMFDGSEIVEGDILLLSLAAANRDPGVFTRPTEFDPGRPTHPKPLTFARGYHACLGNVAAKMIAAAFVAEASQVDSPLLHQAPVAWRRSMAYQVPTDVKVATR